MNNYFVTFAAMAVALVVLAYFAHSTVSPFQ